MYDRFDAKMSQMCRLSASRNEEIVRMPKTG